MNGQNKTTTAAVPLAIESREQKHARRIAAAHARHPEIKLELFPRKDGFMPDFEHISGVQYLITGDDAARITLTRMSANTGTKLYTDLLNAAHLDRQNRNAAQIESERAEAQAAADHHTEAAKNAAKNAKYYRRISNTLTRSDEERAAALVLATAYSREADEHTRAAKKYRSKAKSKQAAIDAAAGSDYFEDIAQSAAAAAIEAQRNGESIKTTRTAASDEVGNLAHPDANNTCRTDAKLLTREEAAALMNRYAVDLYEQPPRHYESRTKGNKNTYFTFEVRTQNAEYKKLVKDAAEGDTAAQSRLDSLARAIDPNTGKPGVICKVTHRYTVAPYITVDFWNMENPIEDARNNGINAIFKQSDVEAITDWFNRANLTERSRLLVTRAADSTAAAHAKAARAAEHKEHAEKLKTADKKHFAEYFRDYQKAEDKAAAAARWESAFDRTGIYAEKTRANLKSQIKKALTAALNAPEMTVETPEEYEERNTRKYSRMMKDSRRGCRTEDSRRPDMVEIWTAAESITYIDKDGNQTERRKATTAAAVVAWSPTPDCYPVTAAELKAAENAARAARTAEINAHGEDVTAIEYRRIIAAHISREDWTQTAAEMYTKTHTAAAAALAIFDNWTARERAEAARAYQRARAREEAETRRAAERRPGFRSQVYALAPDWEVWKTFTEEEKAEHNRYFEAIRTR